MTWKRIARCKSCGEELSRGEESYSHGVCPYCGRISGGTFCDVTVCAGRWVVDYEPSWWRRWFFCESPRGHWEYRE